MNKRMTSDLDVAAIRNAARLRKHDVAGVIVLTIRCVCAVWN